MGWLETQAVSAVLGADRRSRSKGRAEEAGELVVSEAGSASAGSLRGWVTTQDRKEDMRQLKFLSL